MNLKGSLPLLILHILSYGPNHGYQINKLIYKLSGTVLDFKEGTLYPTLHNLQKDGLVESETSQTGGRRRRVYHLTKRGQQALDQNRAEWHEFKEAVNAVLKSDGKDIDDLLTDD